MKNLFIFSILLIPFVFSACQDDESLPPITMEGRNTFGCLVNGKLFLIKDRFGQSGTHAEIFKRPDTVAINIYASNPNNNQSIFISIIDSPELEVNKIYYFDNDRCCGLQYLDYNNKISCSYEKPVNGYINLSKVDLNKGILAGTFEFTAYSNECEDTVIVSKGRFDIGDFAY